MAERVYLNTTEIQRGDIVHAHGLRVLIDCDPHTFPTGAGDPATALTCYSWVGLVLNPEDAEGRIPRSWLYTDGVGQPQAEPRWNVQGNELANWWVERP
jgi:hypothetical protein